MKFQLSLETLDTELQTVNNLVGDKLIPEELKNLIVWITTEGKLRFGAYGGNLTTATNIDAIVTPNGVITEDLFLNLRVRDINKILGTLKGLSQTKVESIEFELTDAETIMHVHEVAKDAENEYAEALKQTSKYRIPRTNLQAYVKNELVKVQFDISGEGKVVETIDTSVLNVFLETMHPTVAKETTETSKYLVFSQDEIYSVLATNVNYMPNKLVAMYPTFHGFRLMNTVVGFIRNFVNGHETIEFHKNAEQEGVAVLTIKAGESVTVIKCADLKKALDINQFLQAPPNAIVVNKFYLFDVLKRLSLSDEPSVIDVRITDGVGTMLVENKVYRQDIPVFRAKGEGEYTFQIKAELFTSLLFGKLSEFSDEVHLNFEVTERGATIMACNDATGLWQSKILGLQKATVGNYKW